MPTVVASLYRFTAFPDPASLVDPLRRAADEHGITGTLLLATEGVNGTIAGSGAGVDAVIDHLRTLPGCADLSARRSEVTHQPFARLKVRVKPEIVTFDVGRVDPTTGAGTYVDPADWDDLVDADDVVLIDTRNDYEVAIGTFRGAVDPGTARFRDFPDWWRANADRFAGKRVAMFCTGGIRCEKSTSWLRQQGMEEVFHLRGGILAYLEQIAPHQSSWEGECFVFDDRVSVGHGLVPGDHLLCHACRRPLTPAQAEDPAYVVGISCPQCINERSRQARARYAERQRQVELAAARGATHLGGGAPTRS